MGTRGAQRLSRARLAQGSVGFYQAEPGLVLFVKSRAPGLVLFVKSREPGFAKSYSLLGLSHGFVILHNLLFNPTAERVFQRATSVVPAITLAARKHFGKRRPTEIASAEV